jgi:hypothetical protein
MKTPHRRILALGIVHAAAVHFLAFTVAKMGCFDHRRYPEFALYLSFMALILAQVALVALWAGLGRARTWIRLPVAAAGIVYLGTVWSLILRHLSIQIYSLTVLAGCLMWAGTVVVRRLRAQLVLAAAGGPEPEGLQFTIRHLLILTFLVACLTAGGKAAAPHFLPASLLVIIVLSGVSFTAVGLAAMWAMLGERRPWLRCIATILIAAGFALLVKFVHPSQMYEWLCVLMMEAIWLLLSLYVVRRCGYRLVSVRRPAS